MKRDGPDSLRSWFIAAGCCFINMMMFGMARLSGVLFVASVPVFHVTREEASFPYTLSQAIRNTAGPLVGYLGQKFGVRFVTSLGCIIAAIGIGTCYLAENIATITVLWGVIFGLGFGLGNILLPISINQYFDKKRATASGISFSGACIGSFAIPPIVELLINSYGLSGTFLFLSAFVLNCLPAALLLKKPNFTINSRKQTLEEDCEKQSITYGKKVKLYTVENTSQDVDTLKQRDSFNCKTKPDDSSKDSHFLEKFRTTNVTSTIKKSIKQLSTETVDRENRIENIKHTNEAPVSNLTTNETINTKINSNNDDLPFNFTRTQSTGSIKHLTKEDDLNNTYSKSYNEIYSNPVFPANSNFKTYQKDFYERSTSFTPSVSDCPNNQEKTSPDLFSIIFDPIFILIALTNAVYSAMFVCMITVIVDFARDINVGETNEKYIIMSLSVGDLIGRLGLGWVTDGGYMSRSNFAALCFFFQGVITAAVAWSTGFVVLLIMAALYGLSEAGLILIFPLLVAEYIDEEKQTVAIPSSYFLSGPLCLTVAPLIGFFRDDIGSYDFIFYGIGIISLVCAICWLLAPCIDRCRRRRH